MKPILLSLNRVQVLGLILFLAMITSMLSIYYIAPQVNNIIDLYRGLPKSILAAEHPVDVIKVKGITGEVKITWDEWGVPHIYAYTEEDLFFALGYVMAVDRLWQMDLLRRAAEGNLSAWFGEDYVDKDMFMRKLGILEKSKQTYTYIKTLSEGQHVAELLDAFTLGVNTRINEVVEENLLPPEYLILGVKPEKWRPWDSIAIGYLMTYTLSFNSDDIKLEEFIKANGVDSLVELDILNRSLNTPILNSTFITMSTKISYNKTIIREEKLNIHLSKGVVKFIDQVKSTITAITGMYGLSNNWVVHGDLTDTGHPILANDPHLQLTLPPIWYLAQIALYDDSYNVFGAFIPGIPFPIIARNHYVSWGFTNAPVDVVDYYYYKWRGNKYYYKDTWLEPHVRIEELKVRTKHGYETITFKVLETIHGPIIDDKDKIAVQWTGLLVNTGLIAFYKASKAKSIHEVVSAFNEYYVTPPQNMVIADRSNIAYLLVGAIPIRSGGYINVSGKLILNRGFLPFNGSLGEGEWHKWIPPQDKPYVLNPPSKIIATANNKPVDTSKYPYYLGWHWLDRYRYLRILEYLESLKEISVGDNMNLQHDVKAKDAEILLPLMIKLVEKEPISNPDVIEALRLLKNWDYVMPTDKVEPSIYTLWLMKFHQALWKDELEKAGISDEAFLTLEFTEHVLRSELEKPGSMAKWVDENISMLLLKSLEEALRELKHYGGGDWRNTQWGKIHYYSIEHPLGRFIESFNYKPIQAPGGFYTVNVAPWLKVTIGPSLRVVFDMSSDKSVAIIPGGELGNPFSKYYDNLVEPWLNGVYLVLWLPTKYEGKGEKLILRPG